MIHDIIELSRELTDEERSALIDCVQDGTFDLATMLIVEEMSNLTHD